jgi:hypothetical protein
MMTLSMTGTSIIVSRLGLIVEPSEVMIEYSREQEHGINLFATVLYTMTNTYSWWVMNVITLYHS